MHQRQKIRQAVVDALRNKTSAEDRVAETRILPWRRHQLPGIAVYTLSETVDEASAQTAPRELERTVQLAIEAAVRYSDDVDDALDSLAEEIERVIHADDTLGGNASDCVLSATEVDIVGDADQMIGAIRLTYNVKYYTYAPAAEDVELDAFRKAHIRYNLGSQQNAQDEAVDVVEVDGPDGGDEDGESGEDEDEEEP